MPPIGPEILVLPPLAMAAGIDLYLTLLFLGASPTIGLWEQPLPGALADLDSPGVMIVVGTMYLLEFAAERYAPATLVWNALHAIIRPVSGALLALLVLDGQPMVIVVTGAIVAGLLASLAHAVRSGSAIIRWLGAVSTPNVLLVSLFEDTLVLGMVALSLDSPAWALGAAGALALIVSPRVYSDVRAFVFAVQLAVGRVFQTLTRRRWLEPEELPAWVRGSLEDDDALAPGGALRGSPVGAHRLPGSPRFVTGWVLVRGGSPVLVFRRRWAVHTVFLDRFGAQEILERGFFRRVDLRTGEDGKGCVFFSLDGPSMASLRAEFLGGARVGV